MPIKSVLFTLALLVLCPISVAADVAVGFEAGSPRSPAAGEVQAVVIVKVSPGDKVLSLELVAVNPKGGEGGQAICRFDPKKKAWRGRITGLPKSTYDVQAKLTVLTNKNEVVYFSPTRQLSVK